MELDVAKLPSRDVYRLLTSILVPRPIAWVGSQSHDGTPNLAPFSYFMGVGSDPPAVAISVALSRGELKDTARNIMETGVFTVSIPSVDHVEAVATSAGGWPSSVSEFEQAGLTAVPGTWVDAPRPAEARATFECRRIHHHDVGHVRLIVGQIVGFHIDDAVVRGQADGKLRVDPDALAPLARLGGVSYSTLGDRIDKPTPKVG